MHATMSLSTISSIRAITLFASATCSFVAGQSPSSACASLPCPAGSSSMFATGSTNEAVTVLGHDSLSNYLSYNFSQASATSMPGNFSDFTIEFWMNGLRASSTTVWPVSYSTGHVASGTYNAIVLGFTPHAGGTRIQAIVGGQTLSSCYRQVQNYTSHWHHYAFTYTAQTGAAIFSVFVDGIAVGGPCNYSPTRPAILGGGNLVLFQEQDTHGGGFDIGQAFSGSMDSFRIWSVARSSAQIRQFLDVATLPPPSSGLLEGLIVEWAFDESLTSMPRGMTMYGSGDTFAPFTTAPANISACGVPCPPAPATCDTNPCPIGSSILFAPGNAAVNVMGQVSINNYLSYNFSQFGGEMPPSMTSFTIEFWMRPNTSISTSGITWPVSYSSAHVLSGTSNAIVLGFQRTSSGGMNIDAIIGAQRVCQHSASNVSIGWHHYAFVYSAPTASSASFGVYLDGLMVGSPCAYTPSRQVVIGGGNLVLFQEQDSHGGGFDIAQALSGAMDEFRFWATQRTSQQILQGFSARLPNVPTTDLIVKWSFDGTLASYPPGMAMTGRGNTFVPSTTVPPHIFPCVPRCLPSRNFVDIYSDGTVTRPYCTWDRSPCQWTPLEQQNCALGLCESSGFVTGVFVSASNNPCTSSITTGSSYYAIIMSSGQVLYGQYSNEARVLARCSNGSATAPPTASPGTGTVITSDGSVTKPYCSWHSSCMWNASAQTECAQALCNASGYGWSGRFVNASNNPCSTSYATGTQWFYSIDRDMLVYTALTNDAAVTAVCTHAVTAPPTTGPPTVTPAPTAPGSAIVVSDGSVARPYCTWNRGPCTWTASGQHNCALRLCMSSGYTHATYISASNNPCTTSVTSGSYYGVIMSSGNASHGAWGNEAAVTARCTVGPAMFESDGTQSKPFCSWNRAPCVWNTTTQTECAQGVCTGMGYQYGTYLGASNNPCLSSHVSGTYYFTLMGTGGSVHSGSWTNDASVNASCYSGELVTVVSDGTRARPYCSWNRSPCVWNSTAKTNCAQALCTASGYQFVAYVSTSNDPCTDPSAVPGAHYYVMMTTGAVSYTSYDRESSVTASCVNTGFTVPTPPPTAAPPTTILVGSTTASGVTQAPSHAPSFGAQSSAPSTSSPTSTSTAPGLTMTPKAPQGSTKNKSRGGASPMVIGIIVAGVLVGVLIAMVAVKTKVCRKGRRIKVSVRHNATYTEIVENDIFNVSSGEVPEADDDDVAMLDLEGEASSEEMEGDM
eukprot:m.772384 g.772384  ORF g.772384 m.772384 type:complete len:1239 (+) comp23247_c0_seq4:176-3892(+)